MDFFVLRNKDSVDRLCDLLKQRRLPMKIMVDDIYAKRSIDLNDYYWAVVIKRISDETGDSPEAVHEGYKKLFNYKGEFTYNDLTKRYEFVVGTKSTANRNTREFMDYLFKVRADAELTMNIIIELPNESFIEPLNFEFENTVKKRRL